MNSQRAILSNESNYTVFRVGDKVIRFRAPYALVRSKKMMQLTDTAIDLMRRKHKKGEFYYWILYYAYLSPQQCENAGAILQSLETKGISISLRTYYVHRDEAIEVLSSILWGYTSQDCEKITKLLTLD